MFHLGNIVSKTNLNDIPLIKMVDDFTKIDDKCPTLLVGYYSFKDDYKLDFINKRINERLFWTLGKTEDRTTYNRDVTSFIEYCEKIFFESFTYYHIDPFIIKLKTVKRILRNLNNETTYIIKNDFLYFLTNGVTFGINIDILDIYGVEKNKFIRKVLKGGFKKVTLKNIKEVNDNLEDFKVDDAHILYIYEKISS